MFLEKCRFLKSTKMTLCNAISCFCVSHGDTFLFLNIKLDFPFLSGYIFASNTDFSYPFWFWVSKEILLKSKNQKWLTSYPDLSVRGPVLTWLFFFPKEDRIIRFSKLSVLFGRSCNVFNTAWGIRRFEPWLHHLLCSHSVLRPII